MFSSSSICFLGRTFTFMSDYGDSGGKVVKRRGASDSTPKFRLKAGRCGPLTRGLLFRIQFNGFEVVCQAVPMVLFYGERQRRNLKELKSLPLRIVHESPQFRVHRSLPQQTLTTQTFEFLRFCRTFSLRCHCE